MYLNYRCYKTKTGPGNKGQVRASVLGAAQDHEEKAEEDPRVSFGSSARSKQVPGRLEGGADMGSLGAQEEDLEGTVPLGNCR